MFDILAAPKLQYTEYSTKHSNISTIPVYKHPYVVAEPSLKPRDLWVLQFIRYCNTVNSSGQHQLTLSYVGQPIAATETLATLLT